MSDGGQLVLTSDEERRLEEIGAKVAPIVQAAGEIEVRSSVEAAAATEFLALLAKEKKAGEKARLEVVGPLNQHVRFLNDSFKARASPLDEADALVRPKVLAYKREQDRLWTEAEARALRLEKEQRREAEAEKRRLEEEARVERKRSAREAARAAAEREAAERARRQARSSELEREMAGMSDAELLAVPSDQAGGDSERFEAAEAEIHVRAVAARAAKRAEEAEAEAEAARVAERDVLAAPVAETPSYEVAAAAPMRSGSGSASTAKTWVARVVDEGRVPLKYRPVSERLINADVRAGVRKIPGVEIVQKESLRVRAK